MRRFWLSIVIMITVALLFYSCASLVVPPVTNPVERIFQAITDPKYWEYYRVEEPIQVKGEITFTSGLIGDNLSTVYANQTHIFVSGYEGGYSYFAWKDLPNPRGKIKNYFLRIGRIGFVPGQVQWAEDSSGRVYALYWDKILDALNGEILFDSSTYTEGSSFGPNESRGSGWMNQRFLIDSDGNFWVGAYEPKRNFDENSNLRYGLFKIYKEGTSWKSENLHPGYDVWRIYKDSQERIWVSALDGVYYYDPLKNELVKVFGFDRNGLKPDEIYDREDEGNYLFCEDIVEYNGEIYFLMKNFFSSPDIVNNKLYSLYFYEYEEQELQYLQELPEQFRQTAHAKLFVYKGKLYVLHGEWGDVFDVEDKKYYNLRNGEDVGWTKEPLGTWISVCTIDGKEVLLTVYERIHEIGLAIFGWRDEPIRLTQATTSEGLVSNWVENIFYDEYNGKTYLSHSSVSSITFGYTIIDENGVFVPNVFREAVSTIFRYNNTLYLVTNHVFRCVDESSMKFERFAEFKTCWEKVRVHNNYLWSIITYGNAYDDSDLFCIDLSENPPRTLRTTNLDEFASYERELKIGIPKCEVFDLIGVDEDAVFIAVGSVEDQEKKFPYIYQYSYSTNEVKIVEIPNQEELGIRTFVRGEDGKIYAIGVKSIYVYNGENWSRFLDLNLSYRDLQYAVAVMRGEWLFLASRWRGLYVINIETKRFKFYRSQEIGLGAIRTVEIGKEQNKEVLWVGSVNGLGKFKLGELLSGND